MAETLVARLDKKTGARVLCGRARCDGQLAEIWTNPQEAEKDGLPVEISVDVAVFSPGWAPDSEGVWRLTRHAARRIAKGLDPKFRRSSVAPGMRIHPAYVGTH